MSVEYTATERLNQAADELETALAIARRKASPELARAMERALDAALLAAELAAEEGL